MDVTATPRDVTSRDDLRNEKLIEWSAYSEVSERVLRFSFAQGTPRCFGIRTVVDEDDDQVRVAVLEGTVPDAPDVCTLVAMMGTVLVELAAPLGERVVRPLPEAEAGPR